MKLKPSRIKVIAKKQPDSVRVEVKDLDKKDGRKVFSFNLYDTSLEEVMTVLIQTFEYETRNRFSPEIKEELGLPLEMITIRSYARAAGKKADAVKQVRKMVREGQIVGIPHVKNPDGWLELLKNDDYEVLAKPMTKNKRVTGYTFFRKNQ